MEPRYRIKTPQGYYFTEGYGSRKYGRMYGTKQQALIMCEQHTRQMLEVLDVAYEDEEIEKELVRGHIPCPYCKQGV